MRWLERFFGPQHPMELRFPGKLACLAEQDGAAERLLKDRWRAAFHGDRTVLRAYLVRATHDGGQAVNVVLALRNESGHDDIALVSAVSECFRAIFSKHQALDITFLDDTTENEVRQVCAPFYTRVA